MFNGEVFLREQNMFLYDTDVMGRWREVGMQSAEEGC